VGCNPEIAKGQGHGLKASGSRRNNVRKSFSTLKPGINPKTEPFYEQSICF
jgi:hypothetical protein